MSDVVTNPQPPSTVREIDRSPRLSTKSLTLLLGLMCLVPVATIFAIFNYMPPVHENKLQATVEGVDLPDQATYDLPFDDRPPLKKKGKLRVTNTGPDNWTNYNIRINRQFGDSYQIYEHHEPINAGESKEFELAEFVSRSGARFDLRYNPLRNVEIYARLPSSERATFNYVFEKNSPSPEK
jgi:hypothetical protein